MIGNAPFFVVGILFFWGILAVFTQKNLIKIAMAISILGASVNMFLVALGYRTGGRIPIHFLEGTEAPWYFPRLRP